MVADALQLRVVKMTEELPPGSIRAAADSQAHTFAVTDLADCMLRWETLPGMGAMGPDDSGYTEAPEVGIASVAYPCMRKRVALAWAGPHSSHRPGTRRWDRCIESSAAAAESTKDKSDACYAQEDTERKSLAPVIASL